MARLETKSILRSMVTVRLSGSSRDILVLGSDAGSVTLVDFGRDDNETHRSSSAVSAVPRILHNPIFGKTGCRRDTPGQYLASDSKGRALMISATEKRKLVFVMNRDASGNPTIASPLEAHRARTIVIATVGLDNGYDNPMFGSLEYQYPEDSEESHDSMVDDDSSVVPKLELQLAYYELDLGLNHVSRRWATSPRISSAFFSIIGIRRSKVNES